MTGLSCLFKPLLVSLKPYPRGLVGRVHYAEYCPRCYLRRRQSERRVEAYVMYCQRGETSVSVSQKKDIFWFT